MKFEIKNRFTNEVSFTAEIECAEDARVSLKLGLAAKWGLKQQISLRSADLRSADLRSADLSYADLSYADLRSADLSYADLSSANLRSADLRYANLSYADLRSADLRSANLRSADLRSANLSYADLRYADLSYADLRSADLRSAKNMKLPTGELFSDYLASTMPALLTAGGQSLASFKNHWTCHDWDNCPMAHAFGVKSEDQTPLLLRPRVSQFVQLFDANQLPWEAVQAAIDKEAAK